MVAHTIPVDLLNPGQVFACLGFLEAADVLLGNAEGGFDWRNEGDARFALSADGRCNPFEAVLAFLAEAEPRRWGPVGYADPPPKKGKSDDGGDEAGDDVSGDDPGAEGEPPALDLSPAFPAKVGDRMALPIRLGSGGSPVVDLGHWADGSTRDNFKLYAGNRSAHGIARAMLTGVRKKSTARQRANGEPGDLTSPTATRRRSPSWRPAIASAMRLFGRRRFRRRRRRHSATSSIAAMPPRSPSSLRHRWCSASGIPATRRPSCRASCSP